LSHLWERNRAQDHFFSLISIGGPPPIGSLTEGMPFPITIESFLAMFARHACDKAAHRLASRQLVVAKLKCAPDIVVGFLIRGADEYATYRGRGAQQQDMV
jgi:hypothetical protein